MKQRALMPIADDQERLLGSPEVRHLLGISQSSLERRVREKALPAPRKIGGKNVWRASDINAYGSSLFADRVRDMSRASVSDLMPDEVEEAAFTLAARALSSRLHHVVTPEDVTISTTRPMTAAEHDEQDARLLATSPFAGLDLQASFIVAAGLFPELRKTFRQHRLNGGMIADSDAEALRRAQVMLQAARKRG
jgi:predicted DNA-binding transcriptional regulator AlpA